jgi:uncharacterized protein YhdP
LEKSVHGQVTLQLKRGVIYKFPLISKVFSLLNVSQLLDFRLPDLVSAGMPYDLITGSFAFADGSVATSDLSMNSTSVNLSLVGTSNIVKHEIDTIIGIQPLQTVGKVVNRIPVIGWLLTGKSRRFLVVYYSAKGKWSDPTIAVLPEKSLSKGVYGIFRRIFRLPGALIDDPGRVILGQ